MKVKFLHTLNPLVLFVGGKTMGIQNQDAITIVERTKWYIIENISENIHLLRSCTSRSIMMLIRNVFSENQLIEVQ